MLNINFAEVVIVLTPVPGVTNPWTLKPSSSCNFNSAAHPRAWLSPITIILCFFSTCMIKSRCSKSSWALRQMIQNILNSSTLSQASFCDYNKVSDRPYGINFWATYLGHRERRSGSRNLPRVGFSHKVLQLRPCTPYNHHWPPQIWFPGKREHCGGYWAQR